MLTPKELKAFQKRLEFLMPRANGWSGTYYQCRICGGVVHDRVVHWRWHRGSYLTDVLSTLFGRPDHG